MDEKQTGQFLRSPAMVVTIYVLLALVVFIFIKGNHGLGYRDEPMAQRISCVNNLKQIGLAFKEWALDNGDRFPFNVSTNDGGTMELCSVGEDGFARNPALHLQVMSNELNTPKILVCPEDYSKIPAASFGLLRPENITYRLHTGTNVADKGQKTILMICPIDGNTLYSDGNVVEGMYSK